MHTRLLKHLNLRKLPAYLSVLLLSGIPCHSLDVSLPNVSPNASSALSVHRSRQFVVISEVKLNCELSRTVMFHWNIYKLGEEDTPLLARNSFSELQITPRLLPIGEFSVQLNVSIIGTAMFGVGQGYFKVVSSPLVASINGGSKVARGLERTLIFDASLSYDPDEENPQFSGWYKRKYICVT